MRASRASTRDSTETPSPAGPTDDQALPFVKRFMAGDDRAFDELVDTYQSGVYNICLRMLSNPSDAEDAAQDVFVAVYRGLRGFKARSKGVHVDIPHRSEHVCPLSEDASR